MNSELFKWIECLILEKNMHLTKARELQSRLNQCESDLSIANARIAALIGPEPNDHKSAT